MKSTTVLRPVTVRAMRSAPITASEPVLHSAGAVEAGELADQLRDLAGERMLRADLVAQVELLLHRVEDEVRLPAEQVHAEAVERVDVLVAVEVPDVRALGALDHDLVDDLLEQRAEAVDHARIGHVRAVRCGVGLGLARARDVARDEGVEPRALALGRVRLAAACGCARSRRRPS